MNDRELLAEVLTVTGLSARKLATLYLARDERTMRRWEAGDTPVPAVVRESLEWLLGIDARERDRLLESLSQRVAFDPVAGENRVVLDRRRWNGDTKTLPGGGTQIHLVGGGSLHVGETEGHVRRKLEGRE